MQRKQQLPIKQHGAVMMVTLVFLVVLGIMTLTSMQSSKLQLRMAGNEAVRATAHQISQALVDAVIATPVMTPVIGNKGFTLCTNGQPDCDLASLFMPGVLAADVATGDLSATAELIAISTPPPGTGYSADEFDANYYTLVSTYDRSDEGLGRSSITQGIVILTQKP
jgi:Flp pilus assembly protein TadG